MNWIANKKNRILLGTLIISGIISVIIVAMYFTDASKPISLFNAPSNTPNLTVNLKNDSGVACQYSVNVDGATPLSGTIEKNKEVEIKLIYRWNVEDKLEISVKDEQGAFSYSVRPQLKIIPQHLYNPSNQYQLDAVIQTTGLGVKQFYLK